MLNSRTVRTSATFLACAFLAGAAVAMSGCLVSGHSKSAETGTKIGRETISRIQPGITTQEWVRATLGEPTERSNLSDGTEVWKWHYSRSTKSSSAVFLVFSGSGSAETQTTTYVELKDGLVTRAWQD